MKNGLEQTAIVLLLIGLTTDLAISRAHACGFHSRLTLSRSALNIAYPDASHVTGAIWRGQRAGELPMPDTARLQARGIERERLDKRAFLEATLALRAVGAAMEQQRSDTDIPAISLVLVESMLWTRFEPLGEGIRVHEHLDTSTENDLVIVTDEPVLHAITKGKLTTQRAHQEGYLRLYGSDQQTQAFLDLFGSLGSEPLHREEPLDIYTNFMTRDSSDRGSTGRSRDSRKDK